MIGKRISIGILAWNEAASIGRTIESIFQQDALREAADPIAHVQIICVPNGCSDDTAAKAREAFDRFEARANVPVQTCVHEVTRPSKANAWNVFVHEASDPEADYLVLMDGDVRINDQRSLTSMVRTLEDDPEARVAGARTIKHIAGRRTWNPLHRISLGASEIRATMPGCFAGCFYCARAEALRAFRLPTVLIGEDVFVRATLVTDYFTRPDNTDRIVTAPDASVLFEAYTSPRQVFKNLKRRQVTMAIDAILFDRLWAQSNDQTHGGTLLKQWAAEDPDWDQHWVAEEVRTRRWRTSPTYHYRKWFARLRAMPRLKSLLVAPAALAAGTLDTAASYAANRALRRGEIKGLWFTTETRLG